MTRARPDLDVSAHWLEFPTQPLDWTALFGDDAPVELEIGPGKGLYLVGAGAARPGHRFVGVEMARKYARHAAERVCKAGLPNVRLVAGDARRFLAEFVPEASLHAIHVYFPDPWWKQRHRKRRVVCPQFLDDAARALHVGGRLALATDVAEYFAVMRRLLADHPAFAPETIPDDDPDAGLITNFERKYRLEGREIHRARYRRRDGALPPREDRPCASS